MHWIRQWGSVWMGGLLCVLRGKFMTRSKGTTTVEMSAWGLHISLCGSLKHKAREARAAVKYMRTCVPTHARIHDRLLFGRKDIYHMLGPKTKKGTQNKKTKTNSPTLHPNIKTQKCEIETTVALQWDEQFSNWDVCSHYASTHIQLLINQNPSL